MFAFHLILGQPHELETSNVGDRSLLLAHYCETTHFPARHSSGRVKRENLWKAGGGCEAPDPLAISSLCIMIQRSTYPAVDWAEEGPVVPPRPQGESLSVSHSVSHRPPSLPSAAQGLPSRVAQPASLFLGTCRGRVPGGGSAPSHARRNEGERRGQRAGDRIEVLRIPVSLASCPSQCAAAGSVSRAFAPSSLEPRLDAR